MNLNLSRIELPIRLRPAAALSDEELMRFSEENKPFQIERNRDGEITIMTPVGGIGGTHEMYVSSRLSIWAEEDGTGIAFSPNTGFTLPDSSCLSPDAAWVSRARWDRLTVEEQAGYPPLCPEFVVEIRSRTDSRRLLESKMQLWMENGAQLAWLIDPIEAKVTLYQAGTPPQTVDRPDSISGSGPAAGFQLPCTRLWP